tara:strand:- start:470 stop:2761 length:2292 start_codon:yes stop_codon:yes gene_type:complete
MGNFKSKIWNNFYYYLGTKKVKFSFPKKDIPNEGINIFLCAPKNIVEEKLIESALYHSSVPIQFANKKVKGIKRSEALNVENLQSGNFLLHIREKTPVEEGPLKALTDVLAHAGQKKIKTTITPILFQWHPRRVFEYLLIKLFILLKSVTLIRLMRKSFLGKNLVLKILETYPLDEEILHEFDENELKTYSQDWLDQFFARQSREKKLILGERSKRPEFVLDWIMGLHETKARFEGLNQLEKKQLEDRIARIVSEIDGRRQPFMVRIFATILENVLKILFSKFSISKENLEKIKELSKKNTVIFVPNHQSNFDFPTIFYLLYKNHLPPPFIAAGINMDFWPLGPILRRCGAFFIRRKAKGDELYLSIFKSYVTFLISHKFNMEFYFEGGRSRTGKLLPPRYGMLSWILEASLTKGKYPVVFIPLSIQYEQIMEGALYVRELKGEIKEKESFFTFLKSIRVLRRRFGNVSLNLGKEIFLDDFTGDILDKDSLDKKEKREMLQKLAFEIGHEINGARVVNMISLISLCLLDCKESELSDTELTSYIQNELDYLKEINAPVEEELKSKFDLLLSDAIYELTKLKLIQRNPENNKIFIPGDKRGIATYYKNSILHFFTVDEILELGKDNYRNAIDLFDVLKYDFYFPKKVKKEITGEVSTPKRDRKLLGRSLFYILETYSQGIEAIIENKKSLPEEGNLKKFFKEELQKRYENGRFILPESSFMSTFDGLDQIAIGIKENRIQTKKLEQYLETFSKIKKNFQAHLTN